MTLEEIKRRIERIKEKKHDNEMAHVHEDALREDFIKHIAKRKDKIGGLAREILKTNKINFSRWCA